MVEQPASALGRKCLRHQRIYPMKLFRKSSNGHAERSEASCSHRQGRSTMRARCCALHDRTNTFCRLSKQLQYLPYSCIAALSNKECFSRCHEKAPATGVAGAFRPGGTARRVEKIHNAGPNRRGRRPVPTTFRRCRHPRAARVIFAFVFRLCCPLCQLPLLPAAPSLCPLNLRGRAGSRPLCAPCGCCLGRACWGWRCSCWP